MNPDLEYPKWRQNLAVLWFTQFCSSGAFSIVLPFCPYFMRELLPGASEERIRLYAALSAMLPLLSYTICAPLWGWVADRFGRKKMILRAAFGGGMTLLLMGFAQNVMQFLALRVVQGFLTGTVTATLTLISGTTPPERQGFAMGTISSAVFAARYTESSWGRGAPQNAIVASPTNLSSVPPFFSMQEEVVVSILLRMKTTFSGARRSDIVVKPLTSTKSTAMSQSLPPNARLSVPSLKISFTTEGAT